jgi:type VI protein secretion system component VasA
MLNKAQTEFYLQVMQTRVHRQIEIHSIPSISDQKKDAAMKSQLGWRNKLDVNHFNIRV